MKIVPVKWIDEVLDIALERPLPGRMPMVEAEHLPPVKSARRLQPDVKH
jgi:hypothetical protein